MKRILWMMEAGIRGMEYKDFLHWKQEQAKAELAVLPETPNILTFLREYYGFVSILRTLSVLVLTAVTMLASMIVLKIFAINVGIFDAAIGYALTQIPLISVGLWIRHKYKG